MPDADSLPDEPTDTAGAPADKPAVAVGQTAADLPAEAPSLADAEASADAPLDAPPDVPGKASAEADVDASDAPAIQPSAEVPTVASTDVPADTSPEAPAQAPAPTPAVPELSPAACAARLAELFPALFGPGGPRPLKLRIQADIQQRAPGQFTKKSLSIFLHRYTTGTPYLIALSKAPARIDLDGQPAGELAAEHREAAVTELARRRGMHEARRAAENAARREAETAARQQHAAQADARRDRAALLRAFETTTLTPANFCALKRIAEADLQAALTLARQERAERPQERPPEPRQDQRQDLRHDPRHDTRPADNRGRREGGGRGEGPGRPRNPGRPARPGPR